MSGSPTAPSLIRATKELSRACNELSFAEPVTCVYNPLDYAWKAHQLFLNTYGNGTKDVVFLGMNPGPWGMVQTAVPFGEIAAVRDFIGIEVKIDKPTHEHPKRLIEGFNCKRSEVSGKRLWGLFQDRFKTADKFFENHYVLNYCPLAFMEDSGRNRTPDKIPAGELAPLLEACDKHLEKVINILKPKWVVGVGGYAEQCAIRVLGKDGGPTIARILHPSPASPAANKDWPGTATKQMIEQDIWK